MGGILAHHWAWRRRVAHGQRQEVCGTIVTQLLEDDAVQDPGARRQETSFSSVVARRVLPGHSPTREEGGYFVGWATGGGVNM